MRPLTPRILVIGALVVLGIVLGFTLLSSGSTTPTTTNAALETTVTTDGTTTTAEAGTGTTASSAATTTTSVAPSSSTVATTSTTSTTTTIAAGEPSGNRAPTVEISRPRNLSYHTASFDPDSGVFGKVILFEATATDPDGDPVTIEWISSIEGPLGTGASLEAFISTAGSDSSQPYITARARDKWGRVGEATIQIIVVVPSDT